MIDDLALGRDAYARRAWRKAYGALRAADEVQPLAPPDLERAATAAYLVGRDIDFLQLMERLHRLWIEAGDPERAARCAFWLALTLLFRGDVAQSNAWVARGQRMVEGRDCVERGYLLVPAASQQVHEGDPAAGLAQAMDAVAIGERFRDADLTAAARHLQGRALIRQGDVGAGLTLLDETMLAVVAGELSPVMTGLLYCSVIEACREVCELRRAREWTLALSGWCEQQAEMVAFTGTCLVDRAAFLQFHGTWSDALAEACRACERAAQADRKPPGAALYQQGEIHRLRGEYADAEDAYRVASRLGYEPQPGLALLRLVQGRAEIAAAAMRRLLDATTDRLQRSRLLPAYVEIMLVTRERDEAERACLELQTLAATFGTDALRGLSDQACGALALADGDARAAIEPLRRAFAVWDRLDAPYEAARTRLLIGQACRALGDDEAGALEFDAVQSAFERLGARPDLARLGALRARVPRQDGPLTAREREVLRLIAAGHTNQGIADALRLSKRTVDRHVSNILTKLDVQSRAAATAYAYAHRLL